jgi:PEGA domain
LLTFSGRGSRLLTALLIGATNLSVLTCTSLAFAQNASEKATLAAAESAVLKKDVVRAYDTFVTLREATDPTVKERVRYGLCITGFQSGHPAESHASCTEWNELAKAPKKVPEARRKAVDAALRELDEKTGLLRFAITPDGVEISVDEKPLGLSPLKDALRLTLGPHRVRLSKAGFHPFERAPNVTAGGTGTVLEAKLEAVSNAGRAKIREATGKTARVFIDGKDMGATPWEGELTPGIHELALRGANLASEPQRIEVLAGETRDFDVVAVERDAQLKVIVSEDQGKIFVDGREEGEGKLTIMLAPGEHTIRVMRDGYQTHERKITLKTRDVYTESVSLRLEEKVITQEVANEGRKLEGLYTGVGIYGTVSPTGLYSTMDTKCGKDGLGAVCSNGSPIGGGLLGHIGYHWNPVGLELFMMGGYDNTRHKATFDGVGTLSANRLAVGVAREEAFTVHRYGGLAALRARATVQGELIRFSVAGGIGASYKRLALVREAKSLVNNQTDKYGPDSVGYLSPAVAVDVSLGIRITPTKTAFLGVLFTAENANLSDKATEVATPPQRYLASEGTRPTEIATPTYRLATGGQAYVGITLGLQFGP